MHLVNSASLYTVGPPHKVEQVVHCPSSTTRGATLAIGCSVWCSLCPLLADANRRFKDERCLSLVHTQQCEQPPGDTNLSTKVYLSSELGTH